MPKSSLGCDFETADYWKNLIISTEFYFPEEQRSLLPKTEKKWDWCACEHQNMFNGST
jgi:hypothetical protein